MSEGELGGLSVRIVDKPWGHEQILIEDRYVLKRLVVEPGQRLSLQFHEQKTETLVVESGAMELLLGEDTARYEPGDVVHVPAGTKHRIACAGDETLTIIEASTPELDDVIRLEDDYDRSP